MLPYLFAALTMLSVGKSAGAIINEVRRQFRDDDIKKSFAPGAGPAEIEAAKKKNCGKPRGTRLFALHHNCH
jgi:hypothetical protein